MKTRGRRGPLCEAGLRCWDSGCLGKAGSGITELLFCSYLSKSSNCGDQGETPPVLLPVLLSWTLQKAKTFAKNNFLKCLLLLMFFSAACGKAWRVRDLAFTITTGLGTNERRTKAPTVQALA